MNYFIYHKEGKFTSVRQPITMPKQKGKEFIEKFGDYGELVVESWYPAENSEVIENIIERATEELV